MAFEFVIFLSMFDNGASIEVGKLLVNEMNCLVCRLVPETKVVHRILIQGAEARLFCIFYSLFHRNTFKFNSHRKIRINDSAIS